MNTSRTLALGVALSMLFLTTPEASTESVLTQLDQIPCHARDHDFFQCFLTNQPRLPTDVTFDSRVDLASAMTVRTVLCDHGICRDVQGDGFFGSALHDGRYVISKGYYLATLNGHTFAFRNGSGPMRGVNPSSQRLYP